MGFKRIQWVDMSGVILSVPSLFYPWSRLIAVSETVYGDAAAWGAWLEVM